MRYKYKVEENNSSNNKSCDLIGGQILSLSILMVLVWIGYKQHQERNGVIWYQYCFKKILSVNRIPLV